MKKNVLLVDDNAIDNMFFKKAFSRFESSHTLMEFSNAQEVLNRLENSTIDPYLIFLDTHMPKMSGIDFLILLRSIPKFQDTPVVLFSDNDDPIVRIAKEFRVSKVIPKPVNSSQIEAILTKYNKN